MMAPKGTHPLRVIGLFAENVKMLKVAAITPDRRVMRITGPNASGKSSLIDSIFYALGGARNHPDRMIRIGEDQLTIRLELGGQEVEIIATRVSHYVEEEEKTELTLEAKSGAVFSKPQHVLDALIGALSFDPIAFLRMERKTQMETLRKIVTVDIDLDAIDGEILKLLEARRVHRPTIGPLEDRKIRLRPAIDPDMDVTPISTASLLDDLQKASAHNATIRQETQRRADEALHAQHRRVEAGELREQARRLLEQAESFERHAHAIESELAGLAPIAEPVDVEGIRTQLAGLDTEKASREAQVRARDEYSTAYGAHKDAVALEEQMTEDIESLRQQKRDAIARAKMPVDGLSWGEDGVTFNDLLLPQASQAEQIRVAMAIGMAMNPRLRLICIRDGSLLDSTSHQLIEQIAEEYDFQVWMECVEDEHEAPIVGVRMHAGEVVAINGVPVGTKAVATVAAFEAAMRDGGSFRDGTARND